MDEIIVGKPSVGKSSLLDFSVNVERKLLQEKQRRLSEELHKKIKKNIDQIRETINSKKFKELESFDIHGVRQSPFTLIDILKTGQEYRISLLIRSDS